MTEEKIFLMKFDKEDEEYGLIHWAKEYGIELTKEVETKAWRNASNNPNRQTIALRNVLKYALKDRGFSITEIDDILLSLYEEISDDIFKELKKLEGLK